MTGTNALIIADPSATADELAATLRGDGFEVRHGTAADVPELAQGSALPDMLLASAALGPQGLTRVSEWFTGDGRTPSVVVFPEDDLAALETCVRAGFDYVTPPFRPSLLRNRMASCWERGQLTTAVEDMATSASLREYERELSIAHDIQAGFFPEELPTPAGWEVAARFQPAKQVGGDFYDVFELVNGRRLGLVMADVCDKGIGAALFMALIRTLIRHTAEHTGSLHTAEQVTVAAGPAGLETAVPPLLSVGAGPLVQAVTGTNRYMARNHLRQGYFATLFFGVLDPGSGAMIYINSGHNPPVLARRDGEHTLLYPTGPAVGMMPNSTFSLGHATLGPGDSLFIYTDGVSEARAVDGERFGNERLLNVVNAPERGAHAMLDAMDASVRSHVGAAEQFDDITMLAVHRTP
ncbi:SpoIIE family protein phosphatase [Actinomadura barringtoniae]|uniref:SpoIIE family protein phosphatase n=1 Tax=Actinomadura barringtoniae TaxID=1427535 RepID=A0A939TA75_9ACTN|nr:SpoIIE family protein phosphatase [Actinomadura barringtoniae]MBO2448765.1 SpoIIE family protein phosphatase [Actinomadura barringtoniae]